MLQLGFVSAILPEQSLEQVLQLAARLNYDCVELMCWPVSQADRRYAGVTHIDVVDFSESQVGVIHSLCTETGVGMSGLGYYPNILQPNYDEGARNAEHLKRVIQAARMLGVTRVNTFIGRDWTKSVDDNWPRFLEVWRPLIAFAEEQGVRIGIENCPMLFSQDEWPGGKNLAHSPAIWRRMFADIPSDSFGLNYDPSHMILQHMDHIAPLRDFKDKLFHIHAKDLRMDREQLNQHGAFAFPHFYHTPKLPGMGDVEWGPFFSALTDARYRGPVCVEVEDRAFEGSLDDREQSLVQSATYLRNFIPRKPNR